MKHMPWKLDGYRFFYGDSTEEHLHVNTRIREFLDTDDKFFLIGAKGLGKTLFLRYKSYRYHNTYDEKLKFNVSQNELTENLNIHPNTFSKEDLLQYRSEAQWSTLWQLALWIMAFRIFKEPVNPRLEKIIENGIGLSPILTRLLNYRNRDKQYREFLSEFLDKRQKIHSGVAIFIDDVDQALHNFLRSPHYTDTFYDGDRSPSVEIWINAQMGLIDAIYSMHRQNSHLKIFATIRREAFEAYQGELKGNYLDHASILHYEKDEIRTIFYKNIQLIEPADLVNRHADNILEKFIGFERMPHRFAKDLNGNKRDEDAFDFIYRHTYGRPREIIIMGSEIHRLVSDIPYRSMDNPSRQDRIRLVVNQLSNELLRQYKQEIIPYFDEPELNNFVENVRSNVIRKSELQRLPPLTVQRYFNLGLIGYTLAKNLRNELRQVFRAPAVYNYRNYTPLPESDYYLIHSTLDTTLLERHAFGLFYNQHNIIGNGYDFFPVEEHIIRPDADYIPRAVSGNRINAANEAAGHLCSLGELYDTFFRFDQTPQRFERFMRHWKSAEHVLHLLGRICYCHRMEKEYRDGKYEKRKQEFLKELDNFHFARRYNSMIADSLSEESMERFLDRLIGRFITLGAYLVLDMRIEWIHNLLVRGTFSFEKPSEKNGENGKSNDFAYLMRSFFIHDLKKNEPRKAGNKQHAAAKNLVFSYLSPFEQDALHNFVKDACDEANYVQWIENEAHKTWLNTHVLQKIWKPDC